MSTLPSFKNSLHQILSGFAVEITLNQYLDCRCQADCTSFCIYYIRIGLVTT
jgi:hypothetical protein